MYSLEICRRKSGFAQGDVFGRRAFSSFLILCRCVCLEVCDRKIQVLRWGTSSAGGPSHCFYSLCRGASRRKIQVLRRGLPEPGSKTSESLEGFQPPRTLPGPPKSLSGAGRCREALQRVQGGFEERPNPERNTCREKIQVLRWGTSSAGGPSHCFYSPCRCVFGSLRVPGPFKTFSGLEPPRGLLEHFRRLQGPPKGPPRGLPAAGASQGPPRRQAPGAAQEPPRRLPHSQGPPRGLPGASQEPLRGLPGAPGASQGPFRGLPGASQGPPRGLPGASQGPPRGLPGPPWDLEDKKCGRDTKRNF